LHNDPSFLHSALIAEAAAASPDVDIAAVTVGVAGGGLIVIPSVPSVSVLVTRPSKATVAGRERSTGGPTLTALEALGASVLFLTSLYPAGRVELSPKLVKGQLTA
jgi:hypothetical protein